MSKIYKVPVTWECCGCVKVEAENIDDAIKKFNQIENTTGFDMPVSFNYVDDSFQLSSNDPEQLKDLMKVINKEV